VTPSGTTLVALTPNASPPQGADSALDQRQILSLWWPLAASWLLMGAELPMFSAVVGRMANSEVHLAAFGSLVFPVSLLVEAPIIMLLAASTALAVDGAAYAKLQRFTTTAGVVLTAIHLLVATTPLYDVVARTLLDVPPEVYGPARIGLLIMTPWTWAIAQRRFQQGVLIRNGRSRDVGVGTVVRLVTNATVLISLWRFTDLEGIVVGTTGIACGVTLEAVYIAYRVRPVLRAHVFTAPPGEPLTRARFARFYIPLAMTPLMTLIIQPMGSAAMNRMPESLPSLAAWPPLHGFVFLMRSFGFALNEVVVAQLGRRNGVLALRRFSWTLALVTMGTLAMMGLTPLAGLWFGTLSGLDPRLVELCTAGVLFALLMPGYQALQSWYQGALVHAGKTRPVTEAVAIYLVLASIFLSLSVAFPEGPGLYHALGSFVLAGITQTAWLAYRARPVLAKLLEEQQASK